MIKYFHDPRLGEYLRVDTCTPRSHRYDSHLKKCKVVFKGKGGSWDIHHTMAGDSYLATINEFDPATLERAARFLLMGRV